MRIIECDRCHKRITGAQKVGYVGLDQRDVKTGDLDGGFRDLDDWDFCDECMEEIAKFVQMKPVQERQKVPEGFKAVDVKPKAMIKRPISTDTKYSAITPEKIERIKQLSREGKTVKDIATEVGCSEPTVRKYKAEVADDAVHESDAG